MSQENRKRKDYDDYDDYDSDKTITDDESDGIKNILENDIPNNISIAEKHFLLALNYADLSDIHYRIALKNHFNKNHSDNKSTLFYARCSLCKVRWANYSDTNTKLRYCGSCAQKIVIDGGKDNPVTIVRGFVKKCNFGVLCQNIAIYAEKQSISGKRCEEHKTTTINCDIRAKYCTNCFARVHIISRLCNKCMSKRVVSNVYSSPSSSSSSNILQIQKNNESNLISNKSGEEKK